MQNYIWVPFLTHSLKAERRNKSKHSSIIYHCHRRNYSEKYSDKGKDPKWRVSSYF